jgi:hypothetical protein
MKLTMRPANSFLRPSKWKLYLDLVKSCSICRIRQFQAEMSVSCGRLLQEEKRTVSLCVAENATVDEKNP